MTKTRRRSAAEIIGFHFGADMRDVSEGRYQPTRYANPAIYTVGDDFCAAPSDNKPPRNFPGDWKEIGEHYGRKVFRLSDSQLDDGR